MIYEEKMFLKLEVLDLQANNHINKSIFGHFTTEKKTNQFQLRSNFD